MGCYGSKVPEVLESCIMEIKRRPFREISANAFFSWYSLCDALADRIDNNLWTMRRPYLVFFVMGDLRRIK